MFNFLRNLAWCAFFLAGAGAFYIAAPAAIHSVDNVEILEKNAATLKADWQLTPDFISSHPYLSRVALQLSETRKAYYQGYSRRVVYQHQWALSDAQVQMLTVPAKGTTTRISRQCEHHEPIIRILSEASGVTEQGRTTLTTLEIISTHDDVRAEVVHRTPWWYPTVFTVGPETQNRRPEVARVLPALDMLCD